MIVYRIAAPFAYRAFVVEEHVDDIESLGTLFLAYGRETQKKFQEIRKMEPGILRQRAFREYYTYRQISLKVTIFGLGCLGEIALWFVMRIS